MYRKSRLNRALSGRRYDHDGLAAPAARLSVGGHPEVDDATLDRHAHVRCDSLPVAGDQETGAEGDERGIDGDHSLSHREAAGRSPGQVVRDRVHAQLVRRRLGAARRKDARSENAAEDHSEKRSPPSCSPEHESRTLTDLVRHWDCAPLGKGLFAEFFRFVAGCRHPEGVLVSPTCDGQDRHRRVRPESRQAGTWGLDNRMGAENRPPRGLRRGAAACRRFGVRRPRYPGQAGPGAGDHRRAREPRHEPRRDDRGIQRRERRARPDRRRARDATHGTSSLRARA